MSKDKCARLWHYGDAPGVCPSCGGQDKMPSVRARQEALRHTVHPDGPPHMSVTLPGGIVETFDHILGFEHRISREGHAYAFTVTDAPAREVVAEAERLCALLARGTARSARMRIVGRLVVAPMAAEGQA